ncbi:uncharacterized protein LOC131537991 isoform X2 [Onychostoma macrolepis]|uniref:uncharacterized protein LOC131537991 isoform X2 n=1 Tax=Onychostoma macrolepis TaxID=369639 RepID=UPI00272C0F44|nr:uncharacterized protein LOC131537991 isoform X2 [Onychostoma macrolepis]
MFVKLKKAGGGVLHMGCTHGVIYYTSPLWWQESARDHRDALLSFKYPPTVYISDIAGRVARHVNNRTQQKFFQPNDGRVCAPTDTNISLAAAGKLTVNIEWLKKIRRKPRHAEEPKEMERFSCPHPETGTSDRYSLYDRFHQKKQKRPEERLRSLKVIPDLACLINSSAAEQINRELSSSRYSLCQMKDIHYMFSLRLFFHLHNERLYSSFMKEIEKQSIAEAIRIGLDGKLICGQTGTHTRKPDNSQQQSRSPEAPAKGDSPTMDGYRFSVAMFPINDKNKDKIQQLYAAEKREHDVIARISRYARLLKDTSSQLMPWLYDNTVNCRIAQIASENQNVAALTTDTFILWYRDWLASRKIPDSHLKILENDTQKTLLSRIVGTDQTPETGCHFILWVFDKMEKQIKIYDNTERYMNISPPDMDILKDAYRNVDSLDGWTVCNPQQWRRNDGNNCGVFVCTMAEMEAKGLKMSPELLHTDQLIHLRLYHASCLVENLEIEDLQPKNTSKTKNRCIAQNLGVCIFQEIQQKTMHPDVKTLQWIQCDSCNKWLHSDCAGIDPTMVTVDMPFNCGCDIDKSYPYDKTLHLHLCI